ncbi:Flagellar protofilament ribbon protein family protein [Leishmania donovani]|uniref:Flagellar protofilament ribbon protein family protein n=1 Tax=Leishmania donovani TaxID=5661 RepID=A0A504Y549_LEIDO|nr:Flagellar protofilament ribbon protein family protein [Leishmania donovani]TPP52567.1 Flagellar protofilament ribbon protein family protein [Leishmania donovani]
MEQERDRAFDDRNEEVNHRLYEVEQKVAEQRRLMEKNGADFNRALAEQQRREAVRAKEEDTRLGLQEMAYQMDSDFLNERETVVSELGGSVMAERYKGMSEKQKTLLRAGQDEQLRELRRRRLLEMQAQAAAKRKAQLDELYKNAVDEDYFKYWDRCL